jgi:hypothetical protein
MQLAEAFEPEQQVAEFVLPAKYTLNGVEPFLEDRHVEKWLAAAFGGAPVLGFGLMFGTMPRLKIAFRLRRQS